MTYRNHNAASFQLLISELNSDMEILEELMDKNQLLSRKIKAIEPDGFNWSAPGFTIHNIYGLMENYFLRIAKFFENSTGREAWHRNLIDRMALLKREDLSIFHDLRSFRHVFRNIYQGQLNEERLQKVNHSVPDAVGRLKIAHSRFIDKLKAITAELPL